MDQGIIWGDVVGIRPLLPQDAGTVRRFALDTEVADLLFEDAGGPIPSTMTLAAMIAVQWLNGRPDFAIVDRAKAMIGVVRLWRVSDRNKSAMLTIFIGGRGNWGRGFGTDALRVLLRQAFGPMNLHRVELNVFDFNERAIRSYEKVGFVREGSRREALSRRGIFHDIVVMGILKPDFLALEHARKSTLR